MKTIALLVALIGSPVFAQHGGADHKHTSPHGGIVKSSGNYHLELMQQAGTMTVYLLDKNEKTMPVSGATATALLQTQDGQVTTVTLKPGSNQQLSTTPDKTKSFRKAVVTVAFGDKSASASFDLMATNAQAVPKH